MEVGLIQSPGPMFSPSPILTLPSRLRPYLRQIEATEHRVSCVTGTLIQPLFPLESLCYQLIVSKLIRGLISSLGILQLFRLLQGQICVSKPLWRIVPSKLLGQH